jgi:hypothetical protein
MTSDMAKLELPLRITLVAPPPGVLYCLQRGRDECVDPVRSDGGDVTFELTIQVKPGDDAPDFRGPFVQGPKGDRFIYVRIGTLAGDADSCWTRRLKIPLAGIPGSLIEDAQSPPGAVLSTRVAGKAPNGKPACASARFLDEGAPWARQAARG